MFFRLVRYTLWKPNGPQPKRRIIDRFLMENTMSDDTLLIRPSTEADLPAITAIYADAVRHGTGTFELEPPSVEDMAQRARGHEA